MTPDETNRFIAVEVMGWREVEHAGLLPDYPDDSDEFIYFLKGIHRAKTGRHFDPYHSIADAMRVVEKIGAEADISIVRYVKHSWQVRCRHADETIAHAERADLPAAICMAAVAWAQAKSEVG